MAKNQTHKIDADDVVVGASAEAPRSVEEARRSHPACEC